MITTGLVFDSEINKIADAIKSVSTIAGGEDMIKSLLLNALEKYSGSVHTDKPKKPILKFTKEEINKMPKTFKKEFRADGCTAHIRKRKIGANSFTYDIRYRRNGYSISVTNKSLDVAKEMFIEKLKTAQKVKNHNGIPYTFNAFSLYYFENFRKKKVAERTLKNDYCRYNLYLKPYFDEKPIEDITPYDCQTLIDSINESGKGKTADEIHSLLSVIFKMAIKHNLIKQNPLDIIVHTLHEKQHGNALTKQEEDYLLTHIRNNEYVPAFALALYTGLRPNELITAKVQGEFIVAVNSKRKNKKVEYKKIPITDKLRRYLPNLKIPTAGYMREEFKKVLPNHKLYDLRTTFYSRCKECNVSEYAIKEFMGHSLGALGDAYTDLSDEFLLLEGRKIKY